MKISSLVTTLSASLLLLSGSVMADIAIIVNPANNNAIDASNIKQIFLGKLNSFADGSAAIPITLAEGHSLTEELNDKVIKKSARQLKSYWSKQVFTGAGSPPKVVSAEAEMLKLVASNPNLIGYVSADMVDGSVKVVGKF